MKQFWTIVSRDGTTQAVPIFGRDHAVEAALEMLAKGIAVVFVAPFSIGFDFEIIGEAALRTLARERGFIPKVIE
jgi:hypothetical protein